MSNINLYDIVSRSDFVLSSKVNNVKDQIFDIIEKLCGERPKGRCSVGNLIPILVNLGSSSNKRFRSRGNLDLL